MVIQTAIRGAKIRLTETILGVRVAHL